MPVGLTLRSDQLLEMQRIDTGGRGCLSPEADGLLVTHPDGARASKNKRSLMSRNFGLLPETESLSAAIRDLPSIQSQIAERAYQIYLDAGLPEDVALEHWPAAGIATHWQGAVLPSRTSVGLRNDIRP